MEVNTKSDKVTIGEMADVGLFAPVAEMITDAVRLDTFQPGWGAKGAALATAAEDDKPEFPVVRVEEGWSNSRRLWDASELDSIAAQTNALEPVGHLGHIKAEDAATAFPEPQTAWFGAVTRTEASQDKARIGEMVKVAYFAGYNLPGAKVRGYLKTRTVKGISWWGSAELIKVPGKGVQVKGFQLKALDWARKLAEGMPTSAVVSIASEMEDKDMAKDLAQVTPEEFKAENPNGYALLVAEIEAKSTAKIGEMETKLDAAKTDQDTLNEVRSTLKLKDGDDLLSVLATAMTKLGEKAKFALDAALDKVLAEKVPDEEKRKLVKRLLPVAEMESKLSDTAEDDAEKLVGEMVDDSFDKDELIKQTVGEMAPPAVRRREQLGAGGDQDKNPYTRDRERITLS